MSGYCSGHENGDKKMAYYESVESGNNSTCNNDTQTATNGDYDPDGYLYTIELPQGATTLTLEGYDMPFYGNDNADQEFGGSNQQITTVVTSYNRILTPLDLTTLTAAAQLHQDVHDRPERIDDAAEVDEPVYVDEPGCRYVLHPGADAGADEQQPRVERVRLRPTRMGCSRCAHRSWVAPGTTRTARSSTE